MSAVKHTSCSLWLLSGVGVLLYAWSAAGHAAEPESCAAVARIVSIQGTLQIQRAGQGNWFSVRKLDTTLCQGDVLYVERGSRAALLIGPETVLRLDQGSTVSIRQTADETTVEFTADTGLRSPIRMAPNPCGAGYFITRFPRRFRVLTPFVHASVEGTEFLVAMRCQSSEVAVFEGRIRAEQTISAASQAVSVTSGQSFSVGTDQPPAVKVLVKPTDAVQWVLYYPPLSESGPDLDADQPCDSGSAAERSRCLTSRAERRLRAGRVEEAREDIDAALALGRDNADAYALSSVISVAQNDRAHALQLGQRATQLDPLNPRAWIALSYAQQASFKLEDALASSERAAELAPRISIAQARVAELLMSLGRIRTAERAAQAAVEANPNDSRAHTVLGFVHLAQIDTKKARTDFEAAIDRDSSDPLPRLGLGLAIIRNGNLKVGREQIEIAVGLDPTNSLLRSYVGKAYYEENTKERDKLAATQFGLAEKLDPKDPTPWFYEAILKQTQNRPVEALQDVQKSIELNDNRAVYRSRLLLDQDLGDRTANLAPIYQALGFSQLAMREASRSIEADPTNFSAHSFLAEAYETIPRTQIARESELLQSILRQPLYTNPLQFPRPQDARSLAAPRATIAPRIGLGETFPFTNPRLFQSNGMLVLIDGIRGNEDTFGDNILLSASADNLAFSVGQSRFQSDNFAPNNDLSGTAYSAFLQVKPTSDLDVQAQVLSSSLQFGASEFGFDPNFRTDVRNNNSSTAGRLGARYALTPQSELLLSAFYQSGELRREVIDSGRTGTSVTNAFTGEAQYATTQPAFDLVAGAGYLDGLIHRTDTSFARDSYYDNVYVYSYLGKPSWPVRVTLGLSFDDLKQGLLSEREVCPKLGITASPLPGTVIRAAAFRSVRRQLISNQTLEPTEIAGFNQFFDDFNGSAAWRYGAGIDQRITPYANAGVEASARDIDVPLFFANDVAKFTWREKNARAYLYFSPPSSVDHPGWSWAAKLEYQFDDFQRPDENTGADGIAYLKTQYVPVGFAAFLGEHWSVQLTATHVHQTGRFQVDVDTDQSYVRESFWVADMSLSYQLPRRFGTLSILGYNLFDMRTGYFDIDPSTPRFARGRLVLARVTLSF